MGASASPMRCHGHRGDRTMRRLARVDAGQVLGISPDTVRRRPREDTLAGEREPTPRGAGWWTSQTTHRRPEARTRAHEWPNWKLPRRDWSRAGGPAPGTGDSRRHALSRSGRYDGRTRTAYAGCVTPKSATHDAMPAHGTSGGSLG